MDEAGKLLIGKGELPQYLQLPLANRHGLIAGATGTGKTVTLQVLAEQFSRRRAGVLRRREGRPRPASPSPACPSPRSRSARPSSASPTSPMPRRP